MFQQGYTIVFTEIRPIKINALVSLDGVAASVETSVVEGPLWVDSGSRFCRSRGQSESLLAWLPVVTDHTGSNWGVASAAHICDGTPAIAIQSAVAIASPRLLLASAILHRPSLKDAHSSPMSRSSCAASQRSAPFYSTAKIETSLSLHRKSG